MRALGAGGCRAPTAAAAVDGSAAVARTSIVENNVRERTRNGIVRRLLNIVSSFVCVTMSI
jgi:hypothetical protein